MDELIGFFLHPGFFEKEIICKNLLQIFKFYTASAKSID